MSLHPDPDTAHEFETPQEHHRLIAAGIASLPMTALLSAALWALAGAQTSGAALTAAASLIFAALYPFSLSVQHWRDTPREEHMKQGRFAVGLGSFVTYTLALPGLGFLLGPLSGPAPVIPAALLTLATGWTLWGSLRFGRSVGF